MTKTAAPFPQAPGSKSMNEQNTHRLGATKLSAQSSKSAGLDLASSRATRWPRIVTLAALFSFCGFAATSSGCTVVAGIENREDDGKNKYEVVDKETDIATFNLCVDYCDTVMEKCTETHKVYKSRAVCINTCNALPQGEFDEAIGNTVWCRYERAQAVDPDDPGEECPSAGPSGGDGACGKSCDAWCSMLADACPVDYQAWADCPTACSTIPKSGGFDLDGNYTKDTVECRLIHLGAVGSERDVSDHCGHGSYIAQANCVPPEDEPPTCSRYCDIAMINCKGNDVYESRDECMATCAALPLGENTDKEENTVGCRTYHAKNAAGSAVTHCPHAGPTGDGHCGKIDPGVEGYTGNCESMCILFEQACGDRFAADGYQTIEDCAKECYQDFAGDGAANDVGYVASTATEDDTIQCRIYHATKILAGTETDCDQVALSGTCN